MAKAAVNKSQAIRNYYAEHPRAKPKQVVAGLAEKKIEVNTQMVSTVRYNMKKKRRGGARGRRAAGDAATPARRAQGSGRGELFATLVDAKKLSDRLGGIQRAKQALKMLEQLT